VRIGDATVTFPGNVTDAAWSPDGSRIAFIDGNGNVATAKPDGSDAFALTQTDASVTRSRPTWSRDWIHYAEKKGDTSTLMFVSTNGCPVYGEAASTAGTAWPMDTGDGTSYVDLAPSAALSLRPVRVAFQHTEPSGQQIWINDSNIRGIYTGKIANGSDPALTTDGNKLAYVGQDSYIHVTSWETSAGITKLVDTKLSAGPVAGATRLVWSPDGSKVAFETSTDIEEIAATGGPTTVLANKPGVPSFLDGVQNTLNTVTGPDAVALSVAAAEAGYPGTSQYIPSQGYTGAWEAVITTPADANDAEPQNVYGPKLLTAADSLDDRVKQELQRLFGNLNGQHPILEISTDISMGVETQLAGMGFETHRWAPGPAQQPGAACGNGYFGQTVVVVNADDAAAAGVAADISDKVLYESGGVLTQDQINYLQHGSGVLESAYIIGNVPANVAKQVGDLIAGPLGYKSVANPVVPNIS
jgi:hypothetical protein